MKTPLRLAIESLCQPEQVWTVPDVQVALGYEVHPKAILNYLHQMTKRRVLTRFWTTNGREFFTRGPKCRVWVMEAPTTNVASGNSRAYKLAKAKRDIEAQAEWRARMAAILGTRKEG